MGPLLAFLFFQMLPVPSEVTADFRLAARDGPTAALVNIRDLVQTEAGQTRTLIYVADGNEPASVMVVEAIHDCRTGMVALGKLIKFNRSLEKVSETPGASTARIPQPNSIYGQAHIVVCGSDAVRRTYPYMGSDMRSAIRTADARFR